MACSQAYLLTEKKAFTYEEFKFQNISFTTPTWRMQRRVKKVSEASCFQMVERALMVPTTGEKRSSRHMLGGNNHVHDFWRTHWLRGEIPA